MRRRINYRGRHDLVLRQRMQKAACKRMLDSLHRVIGDYMSKNGILRGLLSPAIVATTHEGDRHGTV